VAGPCQEQPSRHGSGAHATAVDAADDAPRGRHMRRAEVLLLRTGNRLAEQRSETFGLCAAPLGDPHHRVGGEPQRRDLACERHRRTDRGPGCHVGDDRHGTERARRDGVGRDVHPQALITEARHLVLDPLGRAGDRPAESDACHAHERDWQSAGDG
jgi:hypothetical protein